MIGSQLQASTRGTVVPAWSPAGDWILQTNDLVSPDGRQCGRSATMGRSTTLSRATARLLYGLRREKDRLVLFSIEIATGREKIVGTSSLEFFPSSNLSPPIRLSLSPDGRSILYGAGQFTTNLWMLEGFAPTSSIWSRLGLAR